MPNLLGKGLGCLKDPEDERDLPLTRLSAAKRKKLPKKVDRTKRMSPVSNQGDEGTCVGFATVDGMKEYQEKKEWKRSIQLSVRYVYDNAKKLDGSPDEEGTTIRIAMKVLMKKGSLRTSAGLTGPIIPIGPARARTSWPSSTGYRGMSGSGTYKR